MFTLFFQPATKCHTIVSKKSKSFDDFLENEASIIEGATRKEIDDYLLELKIDPLFIMTVSK